MKLTRITAALGALILSLGLAEHRVRDPRYADTDQQRQQPDV